MKKLCEIIFLILILSVDAKAQPVTWMRYYDPTGHIDRGIDVVQAYDGNYVFVANTSNGIFLMKTNIYGLPLWQKFLGDTLSSGCYSMKQTSDSGFVIAGVSEDYAMQLIKTDKEGSIQWVRRYIRIGFATRAYAIKVTDDKGFILCGDIYNSQMGFKSYVVKTDSVGNMLWDNIYNSSEISDIIQLASGNYFSVGYSTLRKIDYWGNELWTLPIGQAVKILQSNDGYLYVGGGHGQFYLGKFDTSGNGFFSRNYFSKASCVGLCFTLSGDVILAGAVGTDTGSNEIAYTKINKDSGNIIYSKIINLQGMSNEGIANVKPTNDNGLIMCGTTNFPTGNEIFDNILAIKADSLGNTSSIVNIKNNFVNFEEFKLYQNYPNPFNPTTKIRYSLVMKSHVKLYISNVNGKIVSVLADQYQSLGDHIYVFDGRDFASGIYFIILQTENYRRVKKMILMK